MLIMGNPVLQQYINLQIDKLVVCKKELIHLQNITRFFTAKKDDVYTKDYVLIQKNIEDLFKKIKELMDEMNNDIAECIKQKSKNFIFLTHYARREKEIETIIEEIGLLARKMVQNTEEYFDQYIPKPLLGRRYSNKALTYFIEKYLDDIKKDNNIQPNSDLRNLIIFWDHSNDYAVYYNLPNYIVRNAFWYYEIPRLIPNLVHEIGHLHKESDRYQAFVDCIGKTVEYDLGDERFIGELYSDFLAYEKLGAAYIFAFFYTVVHKPFYGLFFDPDYDDIIIRKPDIDDVLWRRFVEIAIRIEVLLNLFEYEDRNREDNTIIEHINYIEKFVQKFKEELFELYNEYYVTYVENYEFILDVIDEWVEASLLAWEYDEPRKREPYEEIFLTLWEERIKNAKSWHHNKNVRELILKNILNDSEVSYEPYELVFIKMRWDREQGEENSGTSGICGDQEKASCFVDKNNVVSFETLGIFSSFQLLPQKSQIPYEEIIEYLQEDIQSHNACYTYQLPLIRLWQASANSEDGDNNKGKLGAIFQFQLVSLENNIIKGGFKNLKDNFKEFNCAIYKSLGPNDFVVIVNNVSLETIFAIKEQFNHQKDPFRRTYTTIFLQEKDFEINEGYKVVSRMRLKKDFKSVISDLQECNCEIYCTTGVQDITLEWKIKEFKTIYEKIKTMKKNNIASDIQTFILKCINNKCINKNKN